MKKHTLVIFISFFGYSLLYNLVGRYLSVHGMIIKASDSRSPELSSSTDLFVFFLFTVLVVPLLEEFTYRWPFTNSSGSLKLGLSLLITFWVTYLVDARWEWRLFEPSSLVVKQSDYFLRYIIVFTPVYWLIRRCKSLHLSMNAEFEKSRTKTVVLVLLSSFLFAVSHSRVHSYFDTHIFTALWNAIPLIVFGILSAYLTIKHSFSQSVIFHSLHNAVFFISVLIRTSLA